MSVAEDARRLRAAPRERTSTRPRSPRLANALTAALLFIALPLLTEHQMPRLLQSHHYLNLDVGVALAVAAVSLNLLLGYAGQLSLGHAGLLAVGAFASGIATSRWHLSMFIGIPIAMVVSAAVSFIVGLPALRLRENYLGIVTLVFGFALQYSVLRSTVFSGGSAGVALPRRTWGGSFITDNTVYLVISLLLLLLVWIVDVNVTKTRLGRAFRTIRENEAVAQSFGINVTRYKLLAFVVSGAMAGLAGAMYGHAIGFVNNESPFNYFQSLQLIIIVVVAGMGHRLAVIIAALVFWVFPSFISGLHGWANIIGAAGLMLTVARHPAGLADLLTHRRRPKVDDDADAEMPPLPELPVPARPVEQASYDAGAPVLEVNDVVVRFGGLQAVDHASLVVPHGKIVGLIGPNGAGKSTLFNAVSGLVRIQSGAISYRGQRIEQMANMPVRNLSGGQQRIVEIACLLVTAPDLVMLDEPSAGMAPAAAESLAVRLRDLRDALGRTVLLIEHNVPLVLDTCDYVYVLDAGRIIAQGEPRDVARDPGVIEAYFGREVA